MQSNTSPEDILRANVYRLLAVLLREPPDESHLSILSTMQGDETSLGKAVATLARLAKITTPEAVKLEYNALFIGVTGGELHPYGSHYMADFLHESPLERLRFDMTRVGIGMRPGVNESEDHIAALCEMMAGMILGDFVARSSLEEQKSFFKSHISPWAGKFYKDLQNARNSVFYSAVGSVGAAFVEIEESAFEML